MDIIVKAVVKPTPWANGRGFAGLSPERRREIASRGGKKGHEMGVAHQWTREEAAAAGRKGGRQTRRKRKAEASTVEKAGA